MSSETRRAKEYARQTEIIRRVEVELGDEVICNQCGATFLTYNSDTCNAELHERCPGFNRYEEVRRKHESAVP